jgi:hypothetical protein
VLRMRTRLAGGPGVFPSTTRTNAIHCYSMVGTAVSGKQVLYCMRHEAIEVSYDDEDARVHHVPSTDPPRCVLRHSTRLHLATRTFPRQHLSYLTGSLSCNEQIPPAGRIVLRKRPARPALRPAYAVSDEMARSLS